MKLPDCDSGFRFDSVQDMGEFWYDTGAEQYADAYISMQKDHTDWAQNLYMEIFPEAKHTYLSCINTGAFCLAAKECAAYNEKGLGGLYYLFISLENFHNWMTAVRSRFDEAILLNTIDLDTMPTNLGLVKAEKDAPEVLAILAAALSMRGATLAIVPFIPIFQMVGAAFSAAGAAASLANEIAKSKRQQQPKKTDASVESLRNMFSDISLDGWAGSDTLVSAVFGNLVAQDRIPETMRVGGVKNPAIQVFGWGSWLKDQATKDLDVWFEAAKDSMKQALVWQMIGMYRGIYVIIRDDLENAGRCSNPNNAWDETRKMCYDMMIWNQQTDRHKYFGGARDLEGMWNTYGMDKLVVMRNAVECWESSGGRIGDFQQHARQMVQAGAPAPGPPPCFFRMPVKRGFYKRAHQLGLNGDFPGQEGQGGKIWP